VGAVVFILFIVGTLFSSVLLYEVIRKKYVLHFGKKPAFILKLLLGTALLLVCALTILALLWFIVD
jgi:hypothetical protein